MNSFENYPKWLLEKWQEIADLLAGSLGVSAALIMDIQDELIEVFVSSHSEGNPYSVGGIEEWYGLYCETVIKTQSGLLVKNALKNEKWKNNPDAKLGMIAYLGYPINFPNDKPFGTICILDDKERDFTSLDKALLQHFKVVIELDLALMQSYNLKITELNETMLQESNERMHMEKKLLTSDKRFRTILQTAMDGFWLLDKDGYILNVNETYCRMSGYEVSELLGMHISDLETNETVNEIVTHIQKVIEQGEDRFESRLRRKDGSIFDVEISAKFNIELDGQLVVFLRDITSVKKAEELININRILMSSIIDNTTDAIYVKNTEGKYLFFNHGAEIVTGKRASEVLGKDDFYLFPEMEARIVMDGDRKVMENNRVVSYEETLTDSLGGLRFFLSSKGPLYDKEKNVIGLFGIAHDITDRKMADESLAESQAFLQAAFDNSQAGIAIADAPNGKLRYVNKAGLLIRNKSENELVKNIDIDKYVSTWNILHLDGVPYKDIEVPLARAVLNGETSSEEFIIRRDDFEDRIVLAKAAPIKDNNNNIKAGIVVFLDITEKKRTEEKLIESEQTYKALFDYSGVGISYYTTDGHVISYNQKAAENMGGSSADFVGKSIFDLFPKENAEFYLDRITKCVSSNEPQHYEDFVTLPTGELWFFSTYTRIVDVKGLVKGVQIISHDISELKEKEKVISYLSYHDQLTGLYNRRFFDEELIRLDTSRNLPLTIAMGDVNGLKLVNDSFGHKIGDQLLICVAEVLKKACRQDDIIARVGGDEFSVIFPKTDEKDADMIIQRINRLISQEKIGPLDFSIAFSYGTKTSDESIESILKKAEDHMYRNKLNDSSSLRNSTIRLIMNTLFEKNNRELKHSERVSSLCVDIATALGFKKNEINHIRSAGLMHDIGKIGIDEHVLNSEAKLSDDEWIEVKKHAEIGYRVLSSAPDFSDIAEDVFSHHERWDGNGYPRGIKGESISIYARIITIADAFDAMISERPYRTGDKALRIEDAINEIKKNAGTQFDPEIARIFVEKVLNVAW